MEVSQELGGEYYLVNDTVKKSSLLLSRDAAIVLITEHEDLQRTILRLMKTDDKDEVCMKPLPGDVFLRIAYFKEYLRIDIREMKLQSNGEMSYLKNGVNCSIQSFIQMMTQLKRLFKNTINASVISTTTAGSTALSEVDGKKVAKTTSTRKRKTPAKKTNEKSPPKKTIRKSLKTPKKPVIDISASEGEDGDEDIDDEEEEEAPNSPNI